MSVMARCEDASEIAVVSSKGQVVIPHAIRTKLGIGPKTKLLVCDRNDTIVMKKLTVPDLRKELEAIYKAVDKQIAKYGELTDEEISEIIQKYRRRKKAP